MIKMIALKRFHYPSGPDGRDYQEGEDVIALSERDAKALRLLRVAKDAVAEAPPFQPAVNPAPPPASAPPAVEVTRVSEVEQPTEDEAPKRRYKRRDVTAGRR